MGNQLSNIPRDRSNLANCIIKPIKKNLKPKEPFLFGGDVHWLALAYSNLNLPPNSFVPLSISLLGVYPTFCLLSRRSAPLFPCVPPKTRPSPVVRNYLGGDTHTHKFFATHGWFDATSDTQVFFFFREGLIWLWLGVGAESLKIYLKTFLWVFSLSLLLLLIASLFYIF